MASEKEPGQVCTKCVMDTVSNTEITFDAEGVCSYCKRYDEVLRHQIHEQPGQAAFHDLMRQVKSTSVGKYDCILGVSGGADSSYSAYILHQAGMKVLMVHCDNG